MAELDVDGDDLVLRLSFGEKAAAVHGDPRAPLSALRRIEVLDDGIRGTVHVLIRVGGQVLQEASSSSPYGIATADGKIPE